MIGQLAQRRVSKWARCWLPLLGLVSLYGAGFFPGPGLSQETQDPYRAARLKMVEEQIVREGVRNDENARRQKRRMALHHCPRLWDQSRRPVER